MMEFCSEFPLFYRVYLLNQIGILGKEVDEKIKSAKNDHTFWVLETFYRAKKILINRQKGKHYKFHSDIEVY